MIGVYKITNTENGKVYVGSSNNIEYRISEHLRTLNNATHRNRHLQRAWDKYGETRFEFEVLEHVQDISDLLDREQFWMDSLRAYSPEFGYNICKIAGRTTGYSHTKETRFVLSRKAKERAKSQDFHLLKYSFKPGNKVSEDVLQIIRENNRLNRSGENCAVAKLTHTDVRAIVTKILAGSRDVDIAKEFNVTRKTINNIRFRNTFKLFLSEIVPGDGPIQSSPRALKGEENPSSKLTLPEVTKIRELLDSKNHTITEISKMFNVSWGTVRDIKVGRTWRTEEDK